MAFPGTYNFTYYRGDTSQFVIRPKTANGSAFDLTDFDAAFTIATERGSTGIQTACTAVVNESTDIVTCTITPAVGRTLQPGTYPYDVEIENGIEVYTLLTGTITIVNDITGAV